MIKVRKISKAELLSKMKLAFANSQLPDIFTVLKSVGYKKEQLNGYLAQINEVETLTQKQKKKYGEKYAITDSLKKKRAEIDKIYKKDLAFARVFFKNEVQASTVLELKGSRKQAYAGWHKQVSNFYNQILNNSLLFAKMEMIGVTLQKIDEMLKQLKAIDLINEEQKKKMGEAKKATEKCDQILNELYPHYAELIQFSKILLKNNQFLESMGIEVKRNSN